MNSSVFARLGASRKAVVLACAAGMVGLALVLVAAMVFAGKASFHDFVDLVKWGFGALSAMVATYLTGQSIEDSASRRPGAITAAGDVSVNVSSPPPPGDSSL